MGKEENQDWTHCDDAITDYELPDCIRYYLLINRLPATEKIPVVAMVGEPKCFATYKNKRVRLVMASRMGDIGITEKLDTENGYDERVSIDELSDFTESKVIILSGRISDNTMYDSGRLSILPEKWLYFFLIFSEQL